MDFATAIAIIVSRLFRLGVTDGRMLTPSVHEVIIGGTLIGVEQRGGEGVLFDLGLDRRLLRIVTDGQMDRRDTGNRLGGVCLTGSHRMLVGQANPYWETVSGVTLQVEFDARLPYFTQ